jgi:hypothetical protein
MTRTQKFLAIEAAILAARDVLPNGLTADLMTFVYGELIKVTDEKETLGEYLDKQKNAVILLSVDPGVFGQENYL